MFVTAVVARVPLAGLIAELWPFMWAQIAVLALPDQQAVQYAR